VTEEIGEPVGADEERPSEPVCFGEHLLREGG